jgi:LysM repeat protein/cell wall-associated NlpC family hydrolase
MINRKLSSPILCVIVLSLVANPSLPSQADPASSNATYSGSAAQPAPAATSSGASTTPVAKSSSTYTVVKGDTLTSIAQKFNTTRRKLKKLNDLTTSVVKPGQILLVPSATSGKLATAGHHPKTTSPGATFPRAQPVQDFDIPASTFASCPVPTSDEDSETPAVAPEKPASIAKLVSPAEMAADSARENAATAEITRPVTNAVVPSVVTTTHAIKPAPAYSTSVANSPTFFVAPASKSTNRRASLAAGPNPLFTTPSNDWANRFLAEARALGNRGIEYDEDWRPPGESSSWAMDCSNTARYLYKVTTGIQLPRTASDQYYYLHLQGKAWDVPQTAYGYPDANYLRENLKPGDLLFWENTYRPERQPPITHVMVFLGANSQGQWIMAGSQTSRGGEHNRSNGGPDIYVFRPSQPCGGYTTWLGLVHHRGRFCAFGRPLEADASKLAVAANE